VCYGLDFIDTAHAIAVGGNVIFSSTNGGDSWTSICPALLNFGRAIDFVNSDTGWVVGANGLIIKSTDGGTNWTAQTSGVTQNLNGVQFADYIHGWAIGDGGTILYTSDG